MKDRVPLYPGRVTLTPVPGQANTYDMARADEPTQEGTPLNKASLLKDQTAALFGLDTTATPNDAFAAIGQYNRYWWIRRPATITFEEVLGKAASRVIVGDYASPKVTLNLLYADTIGFDSFGVPYLINPQSLAVSYSTDSVTALGALAGKYIQGNLQSTKNGIYCVAPIVWKVPSSGGSPKQDHSSGAIPQYRILMTVQEVTSKRTITFGDAVEYVVSDDADAYPSYGAKILSVEEHLTELQNVGIRPYTATDNPNYNVTMEYADAIDPTEAISMDNALYYPKPKLLNPQTTEIFYNGDISALNAIRGKYIISDYYLNDSDTQSAGGNFKFILKPEQNATFGLIKESSDTARCYRPYISKAQVVNILYQLDGYVYQSIGRPFADMVNAPKLETVSYVGTGGEGPDNKNTLTFSIIPKIVWFKESPYPSAGYVMYIWGGKVIPSNIGNSNYSLTAEVKDHTLTWYKRSTTASGDQMNTAGKTYVVYALGT